MSLASEEPPTDATGASDPSASDAVGLEIGNGVATITLQTPENRNALSVRVRRGLAGRLDATLADPDVRVIVLTGSGPVFCAGADLKEGPIHVPGTPSVSALLKRIMDGAKPILCVLNGPARAGGIGLAAACDLAIAPDTATFAFTEVRLGVVPAMISVPCLDRMTPRSVARYFLTGEMFDATEAVNTGLLTASAPPEAFAELTRSLIDALLLGAPTALAGTKGLLNKIPGLERDTALSYAEHLSAEFFASADAAEGRHAFAEKRPPRWTI
jgi:methylglutaconyl-CoA hydratase